MADHSVGWAVGLAGKSLAERFRILGYGLVVLCQILMEVVEPKGCVASLNL